MKRIELDDIDILDVGTKYKLCGAIYEGMGQMLLVPFPGEGIGIPEDLILLRMSTEEWERFLNQSDVMDVRGPGKAILRKSQRQIDKNVQWQVFERDGYRCRYCGKSGPLTVDHVILWEDGGASTPDNLISACEKCNRTRGNMPYEEWVYSATYRKVSRGLGCGEHESNHRLIGELARLRSVEAKPRSR